MSAPLTFTPLHDGELLLLAATPGADLAAANYLETEWALSGTAPSYVAVSQPADGRWVVDAGPSADYTTRIIVRRPAEATAMSGTAVVEWHNVSSGEDAAPDWTYLGEEIVRRGHVYVGVSAQYVGVEGGRALVSVDNAADQPSGGLRNRGAERYAALHHPGDAYCYGMFTDALRAVRAAAPDGPFADLAISHVIAVGESQSAFALTTYVNAIQPLEHAADGYLVHSRGGAAMPFGSPGCGLDLDEVRNTAPTLIRDDLEVPVLMLQTETDVLSPRLRYLPARQDDSTYVRLWEVAGAAHADLWLIGPFESFLGSPDPVNRSQHGYVVRAGLRALEAWCRDGIPAPTAPRLEVDTSAAAFVLDDLGNVRGGVRTPAVDVAVTTLSGLAAPDVSPAASLFGRTLAIAPERLARRYPSRAEYLAAYERATDAAIEAGFILADDRNAALAEAQPELLP